MDMKSEAVGLVAYALEQAKESACAAVRDLRRYVTTIDGDKVHIALPGFHEDENGVYTECAVLDLPVMARFLEDNE